MSRAIKLSIETERIHFVTWEGEEMGFVVGTCLEHGDTLVFSTEEGRYPLLLAECGNTRELDQLDELLENRTDTRICNILRWLRDICEYKQQVNLKQHHDIAEGLEHTEFQLKAFEWQMASEDLNAFAIQFRVKRTAIRTTFSAGDRVILRSPTPDLPSGAWGYVCTSWIGRKETDGNFWHQKEVVLVYWLTLKSHDQWLADDLVRYGAFDKTALYRIKSDPNNALWEFHSWRDDGLPIMNLRGFKEISHCYEYEDLVVERKGNSQQ